MATGGPTVPNMQPNEELGFYCRIAKLLLSVGTHTLRELFVHIVGDVGQYLQGQQVRKKLQSAKWVSQYQRKILSPPGGVQADVNEFDITMLSALLLNLCNLSNDDKELIKEIRQHRNKLCHSHDAGITKERFDLTWDDIYNTLCRIALICSREFEDKIKNEIAPLKNAPIDVKREQQYFIVLLEHCLSDGEFQHDIKTLQMEANRTLQQLMERLSVLDHKPMLRHLENLNNTITNNFLTKEEISSKCSALMEDMNESISNHLSSFQAGMQADLQRMSRSLNEASDLVRTGIQEQRQHQQLMEEKMDEISHEERHIVVNLIDDALIDKVTGGIKKIPALIKKKILPDKDASRSSEKTEEMKEHELEQMSCKQHDHDHQIQSDYEIALEAQNQLMYSKMLALSLTTGSDSTCNTTEHDMDAAYMEMIEQASRLNLPRGEGPDTVLLLDTSNNMERDDNFSKLIDITGEILQGIINERVAGLLDENIAFVTFGSWTAVRQHLTNDESLWIEGLGAIRDSGLDGPAILCQGLRLCETAIQGNQNPMEIDNLCISPRIILITDGNISSLSHPSDSFQSKSRESDRQQIYNLVVDMASKNYSVFCVPLCHRNSPRYRFLEKIAHLGSGSIIRPDELQFIARYYRKIVSALLFGSWHLHVSKRSFIEKCLKESKGVTSFTDDEVEDMMEIVTNPDILGYLRASPKDGKYQESYKDLPPLGTRIKQGEHWREDVFYEHHCGPGTGTVVGQEDGSVYVEWDGFEDGIHYLYKYGLNEIYEVRVHDRPRTPEEGKAFLVGCCITRIEWEEDEHEDPLGYGLVFVSSPQFKAFGVRWKNGDLSYYKYDDLLCCVQEEFPSPWCFSDHCSLNKAHGESTRL